MDNKNVRSLHGRIIQNVNKAYMLPTDEPEIERLDVQHRMLFLTAGALCWPMEDVMRTLTPRGSPVRILDIGSGSGRWAIEMAKEFPHAEVLGIDLAPKSPSDTPANCRFEKLDVVANDVSRLQEVYDVVHCRALAGAMHQYQSFLERAAGMLKPGGLVLVVEPELIVYDEMKHPIKPAYINQESENSSWFARLVVELTNRLLVIEDLPPAGVGLSIPKWLGENPRLENIKQKSLYIPIGWQGGDDIELANRDEVARLAQTNYISLAQSFRPGLLEAGMAMEEVDICIQENEAELLQTRVKNYLLWHWCVAQVKLG